MTIQGAASTRLRALRLVGFLEAYYALRYPPVHDITAYGDVLLGPGEVRGAAGVTLRPDEGRLLSADLVDHPPAVQVPTELSGWLAGPVSADEAPRLGPHPDPSRRHLLAVADASAGSEVDSRLSDLPGGVGAGGPFSGARGEVNARAPDSWSLRVARGGAEPPSGWSAAYADPDRPADPDGLTDRGVALGAERASEAEVAAAREDVRRAEELLEVWKANGWRPWAERYREFEAGRTLYRTLFDLRVRMEREGDLFECVWGFARLHWDCGAVRVDQPLFTTPVEVAMDPVSGRLDVTPTRPVTLDVSWSLDLPLRDRAGLNEWKAMLDEEMIEPWEPDFGERLRPVLRAFDHDGVLLSSDQPRARTGSHASVDPADWVLYVRRRQLNLRAFFEEQRRLYEAGAAVPDPFAALAVDEAIATDESSGAGAAETPAEAAVEDEPLLPLAVNEEQLQIVKLAAARAGVTAQGPPGTGKSHTIANLISHYVAHGRRVLVTAAKEQALSVLMDKVPSGIRELCVPVLGSDASSRARLQATVTTIADAAYRRPDRAEIARLETDLASLRAKYSKVTNALKARRAAEAGEVPVPNPPPVVPWTPSSAAAWVRDHRELGWVPDRVSPDTPPPLGLDEFRELAQLCATIDPLTARAALAHLPPAVELPTGAMLGGQRLEREKLRDRLAEVERFVADSSRLEVACRDAGLEHIAETLREKGDWLTEIAGTWLARIIDDSRDPLLVRRWLDLVREAEADREGALACSRALAADTVTIAEETNPARVLLEGLREARDRFAAGKGVGRFQARARRALEQCLVSGRRPSSVADVDLVKYELDRREWRRKLTTRWQNAMTTVDGPGLETSRPPEDVIGEQLVAIREVLDWRSKTWPALADRVKRAGIRVPPEPSAADLRNLSEACVRLQASGRLREIDAADLALHAALQTGRRSPGASELWGELAGAFAAGADDTWDRLVQRCTQLWELRPRAERRGQLLDLLAAGAPRLAADIVDRAAWVQPDQWLEAWDWRRTETWLSTLAEGPQPAELQADLERLAREQRRVTEDLVAARAWAALADSINDRRRTALNRFTAANAKLGKGTGRFAPRWQQELRAAMDDAKDAVPVWIMPIHRVVASFRPTAEPPFDVLIVDEASQVGLLEASVLALARRAIIVGDDQQTSPEHVGAERQPAFDLIEEHLADIRDRRTRFDPDNSLYDIARQRFPQIVQLREHFRCLPRIIEFSNRRWYNGTIVPLRDRPPHPGWQPLGTLYVPGGVRRRSDDANEAEAEAVAQLVACLAADERYAGMTFGIITLLGSGQAPLISGRLLDRFGPTFVEERKLRVGDPAGFQGDERDVVICSLVVAHDPELRIGVMNNAAAARRINVAASRARNQLWIVHSVRPDSFHRDDPRRALLEYCLNSADDTTPKALLDRAESAFESEVITRILAAGYTRVIPQYKVGGFRIDIVVEGPESRLAIECDGDRWHGPDAWDRDRARQEVLERAGWTFQRIRGSAFYRDPNAALEPLWSRLEELNIPQGDWVGVSAVSRLRWTWPDDLAERPKVVANTHTHPAALRETEGVIAPPATSSPSAVAASHDSPSGPERVAPSEVRAWARGRGITVGERGRLAPEVIAEWDTAHPDRPFGS